MARMVHANTTTATRTRTAPEIVWTESVNVYSEHKAGFSNQCEAVVRRANGTHMKPQLLL
jgi:hypothetical protein